MVLEVYTSIFGNKKCWKYYYVKNAILNRQEISIFICKKITKQSLMKLKKKKKSIALSMEVWLFRKNTFNVPQMNFMQNSANCFQL